MCASAHSPAEFLQRSFYATSPETPRDRLDDPAEQRWKAPGKANGFHLNEHAIGAFDHVRKRGRAPEVSAVVAWRELSFLCSPGIAQLTYLF